MNDKLSWENHRGNYICTKGNFDLIDCDICKFRHIIPIPDVQALANIYKDKYYSKDVPLYLDQDKEDLEWWNLTFDEQLKTLETLLKNKTNKKVLDIGSGPGYFLLRAKKLYWSCYGVEPSVKAAEHSRELGLDIINDFFSNDLIKKFDTKFDVIRLRNVLEHLPNPIETIALTKSILNPKGILFVTVPNDFNPFQLTLQSECEFEDWWVSPPHHINYFNFDSICHLLETHNFEILQKETSFPMELFLLMGENYINDPGLGKACHKKRKNYEILLSKAGFNEVKNNLFRALAKSNLGREAIIYCKLKEDN